MRVQYIIFDLLLFTYQEALLKVDMNLMKLTSTPYLFRSINKLYTAEPAHFIIKAT